MLEAAYTPGVRQARLSDLNPNGPSFDGPARSDTALTVIIRRLIDTQDRVAHLTARLGVANDRNLGPTPTLASGSKDAGAMPMAAVDEIHVLLDRMNQTVTWLETEVERAERL